MSDCPLVRLAYNRQLLKKFDDSGMVVMPVDEWPWFFEALTAIAQDADQRLIYCSIVEDYLVFSKTPFKQKPDEAPNRKADR